MKSTRMPAVAIAPVAVVAICTLAAISAYAQSSDQARTAHQDTKFLEAANQGSVDEIDLAQLALKKSNNDDVKAFAQKMIDDHTKLINDMKRFDYEAGVQVPSHPDAAAEATKLKLDILTGSAFDKAYIKAMVEDHHKDLEDFIREEKATAYPAFKDAVEQGAQVVRGHLELIDQLAKKNGVAPAPVPTSGM
jgi:putative membrane protein